uniref:Predicted gene, 17720 n=1 Tax=Peromyscus maniculatus bairdii TaxID=230844 RepID=A0A8C8TF59_PERMB
TLQFLFQVS